MIAARAFVIQKLPLRSKVDPGGVGLHGPMRLNPLVC